MVVNYISVARMCYICTNTRSSVKPTSTRALPCANECFGIAVARKLKRKTDQFEPCGSSPVVCECNLILLTIVIQHQHPNLSEDTSMCC